MNSGAGTPGLDHGNTRLELESVSRTIQTTVVLRSLTLSFECRQSVLLLGANGAGKSTLLRICAGLMRASSGAVRLRTADGVSPLAPAQVGYMGHHSMLYGELTVQENLEHAGALLGLGQVQVAEALGRWELDRHLKKRPVELSKGLLARAALCRAFMHRPRYLFLDEPSSALDQRSCEILLQEAASLRAIHHNQMLILTATHDITRLRSLAERVVVLGNGALLHDSARSGEIPENAVSHAISTYLEHNR